VKLDRLPAGLPMRPGWYTCVRYRKPSILDRILRRRPRETELLVHVRQGLVPESKDPERPFFRVTRTLSPAEFRASKCSPADLMRLMEIEAAREFLLVTGEEPWPIR
jgi:hypothetical protein